MSKRIITVDQARVESLARLIETERLDILDVPRSVRNDAVVDASGQADVTSAPTGSCAGNTSIGRAGCLQDGTPLCNLQKVGAAQLGIVGQTSVNVAVVPTNSQYFRPRAVRFTVTDNADPDINRRVRVSAVTINNFPQEAINVVPGTAANTAFYWSDDYEDPDLCACPVPWGIFSVAALTKALQITVFNPYAAAVLVDFQATVYGEGFDILPPGMKVGPPFNVA